MENNQLASPEKPASQVNLRRYIAEMIGVLFLVLTIVMCGNNGSDSSWRPLMGGAVLSAFTYASWRLSGAHFNPVVSVAMLMRRAFPKADFPYYLLAQSLGALLGAALGGFLLGCSGVTDIRMHQNDAICSVLSEFAGAFALVYIYLHATVSKTGDSNSFFGFAIGITAAVCSFALERVSGGVFNPALALGMCMSGMLAWSDLWIYLAGGVLGGAAAATLFEYLNQEIT